MVSTEVLQRLRDAGGSLRIERRLTRRSIDGTLCHCGEPRVFVARSSFLRKGTPVTRIRHLCELHGRAVAIRFGLEAEEV
jgi:hypothetical protein